MSREMRAATPAEIAGRAPIEVLPTRPGRDDVAGFVVVGQPFASGDLLCLRRFPASSFGPGYASVWHRSPGGNWTVYTSILPEQSCPRFIGAAVSRVIETPIEVDWTGPSELTVTVPAAELRWRMRVASTPVTQMMNLMMSVMPAAAPSHSRATPRTAISRRSRQARSVKGARLVGRVPMAGASDCPRVAIERQVPI